MRCKDAGEIRAALAGGRRAGWCADGCKMRHQAHCVPASGAAAQQCSGSARESQATGARPAETPRNAHPDAGKAHRSVQLYGASNVGRFMPRSSQQGAAHRKIVYVQLYFG
jgi:hypothetical protein